MLERIGPFGVERVVRDVLFVDLFPNVDFSGVRPTFAVVLGHHPKGGEVAFVGMRENAGFDAAVTEGEFAFASDSSADEGLFLYAFEAFGSGHGTANEFAVFQKGDSSIIGAETVPSRFSAEGARPKFIVGLGVVVAFKLFTENR